MPIFGASYGFGSTPSSGGSGVARVTPDLATWDEYPGPSYDHASSSYSGNSGTLETATDLGNLNASLNAGGIVSPVLDLSLYSSIEFQLTVTNIPAQGQGYKGIHFALFDDNSGSFNTGRGVYGGVRRTAAGSYFVTAGIIGSNPDTAQNGGGQPGVVIGQVPIFSSRPSSIMVTGLVSASPLNPDGNGGLAFLTSARIGLFAIVETTNAGNALSIPFTGFSYFLVPVPA